MENQINPRSYRELNEELKKYKEIVDMFSNTVMGGVAKMSVADLTILNATEGYYRMTGYTKEESLLPPFSNCGLNLVLPEDMDKLMSKVQVLLGENKSIRADYRIRKKDGSIAWNAAFCSSMQEQDGIAYIEVFFLDTTQERTTQLQLSSLIDNMTNGLVRMSIHPGVQICYANNEFYRQIGYSPEEFSAPPLKYDYLQLVLPQDQSLLLECAKALIDSGEYRSSVDFRIRNKEGGTRWIRAHLSRLYEELPGEQILQGVMMDITKVREQERQNLLNEERFRIISEQTKDVIFDWDAVTDTIRYSPVFEKMFGYPAPVDFSTDELLASPLFYEEDKPIIAKMIADIRESLSYAECKVRLLSADGSYFWALHRATAIRDEDSKCSHVVGIISDVNDLMENTIELQRKAEHDLLTGLLNRTSGQKVIQNILSDSCKDANYAFIQFDIDRFKQINDFMGHAAGDFALQKIALQMKELFRSDDVLVRMGGDEFAIFLLHPGTRENVEKKLLEFLQKIYCNFKFGEKIYPLSISMGASLYPEDGKDFQSLYEHADSAMYQAKRSGGNRYEFFSDTIGHCRRGLD